MDYDHEFGTIELLIKSDFETRGVDSFSLAIIKAERQIRKLFTFLIFQNPSYSLKDTIHLRNALYENRRVYFQGFINGISLILTKSLEDFYGDNYQKYLEKIEECILVRNKIFHGQVTDRFLSRDELISKTCDIQIWCKQLAFVMTEEIGYDGFGRNSFRKSETKLNLQNLDKFDAIEKYILFIKDNMEIRKVQK